MKRLLAHLLLTVFGLLLALVLAEGLLRVLPLPDLTVLAAFEAPPAAAWKDPAWGDPPDRAFRRHRVIGHEHAPQVDVQVRLAEHDGGSFRFRTNNLGLRRDSETAPEKPDGVLRILVLGDSQTDGYVNNDESFSTLLEAQLASAGWRAEVLNAGVAGYSPAQEYLWYDVHGAALQPDLVLVVFYAGNDALDLLDPSKPNVDPLTGRAIRPKNDDEEDSPSAGLLGQLRLGLLARYAIQAGPLAGPWRQLGLPGAPAQAGGYPAETLVQVFKTCHGCYLQSLQQAARARRDPQAMEAAVARAGAILVRLDQDVRANHGRLVVAFLPTRWEVEPELAGPTVRSVAGLLGLDASDLDYAARVREAVAQRLAEASVPTIDLLPALTSAVTAEGLYYSRDWHLNPRGHRAAALGLARGLAQLDLLPHR